jgi:[ribosomal protein S18]-alanine N-acetyltransferase
VTSAVHLFDADPADLDAIMRVMARAFDPRFGEAWTQGQLRTLFALPGTRLCAGSLNGVIVGFYAARMAGPESELLLLAVDPAARRQQIGSALLKHWQNWANNSGANEYFLEMRADNPARSLYERFGFVECGHRPDYYSGQDGVLRAAVTMRHIVSFDR